MARFEYTIDAYSKDNWGNVSGPIQVVVEANTDDEAIENAKGIVQRETYTVVRIRQLSDAIEKHYDDDDELTTLPAPRETRKFRKG